MTTPLEFTDLPHDVLCAIAKRPGLHDSDRARMATSCPLLRALVLTLNPGVHVAHGCKRANQVIEDALRPNRVKVLHVNTVVRIDSLVRAASDHPVLSELHIHARYYPLNDMFEPLLAVASLTSIFIQGTVNNPSPLLLRDPRVRFDEIHISLHAEAYEFGTWAPRPAEAEGGVNTLSLSGFRASVPLTEALEVAGQAGFRAKNLVIQFVEMDRRAWSHVPRMAAALAPLATDSISCIINEVDGLAIQVLRLVKPTVAPRSICVTNYRALSALDSVLQPGRPLLSFKFIFDSFFPVFSCENTNAFHRLARRADCLILNAVSKDTFLFHNPPDETAITTSFEFVGYMDQLNHFLQSENAASTLKTIHLIFRHMPSPSSVAMLAHSLARLPSLKEVNLFPIRNNKRLHQNELSTFLNGLRLSQTIKTVNLYGQHFEF